MIKTPNLNRLMRHLDPHSLCSRAARGNAGSTVFFYLYFTSVPFLLCFHWRSVSCALPPPRGVEYMWTSVFFSPFIRLKFPNLLLDVWICLLPLGGGSVSNCSLPSANKAQVPSSFNISKAAAVRMMWWWESGSNHFSFSDIMGSYFLGEYYCNLVTWIPRYSIPLEDQLKFYYGNKVAGTRHKDGLGPVALTHYPDINLNSSIQYNQCFQKWCSTNKQGFGLFVLQSSLDDVHSWINQI